MVTTATIMASDAAALATAHALLPRQGQRDLSGVWLQVRRAPLARMAAWLHVAAASTSLLHGPCCGRGWLQAQAVAAIVRAADPRLSKALSAHEDAARPLSYLFQPIFLRLKAPCGPEAREWSRAPIMDLDMNVDADADVGVKHGPGHKRGRETWTWT